LFLLQCKCLSCLSGPRINTIKSKALPDRAFIYCLFTIGISAGVCMALFWDKTIVIFGEERSIAFLFSVFCLAILDCTCTIVFLTYIGNFRGNYTTALYIGEGISSLLPSFFALLQGTGDEEEHDCNNNKTSQTNITTTSSSSSLNSLKKQPRFSISIYFWLLLSTLIVSFVGFLLLEFLPSFQKEKLKKNEIILNKSENKNELKTNNNKLTDKILLLIAITVVAFVLYGFIPGLASYSALPYGNDIMHLCVTLGLITQPISSLIATFIQIKSTLHIWLTTLVGILIACYILVFSCLSPCPPFKDTNWGGYIMVACWIITFALFMFLRCCITSSLKKNHGKNSLFWCGILTQIGQFIGSITTVLLVDIFKVFKEADPCEKLLC
jgi:hypothetical protein